MSIYFQSDKTEQLYCQFCGINQICGHAVGCPVLAEYSWRVYFLSKFFEVADSIAKLAENKLRSRITTEEARMGLGLHQLLQKYGYYLKTTGSMKKR